MSLLEVKGLSKIGDDGVSIDGVSFEITEKGVYGFFGKNGAENTLLASLICGIADADGGDILYKESSLLAGEKQAAKIRRKIGFVPAVCYFPEDMTVFEVLDFTGMARKVSPDKRARQIKEALTLTGLEDKTQILVENLTLAEKKRLGYANALMGNPDAIVIDEPMSDVDAAHKEAIKKLIAMVGRMKVVLLFAKNSSEAEQLCDHVGILASGKLLAFEPLDALLERLNKRVVAMLRIREKGASRKDVTDELLSVDGIASVRVSGNTGTITDLMIECTAREGMAARIGEKTDALGVEVVSLKFASLSIADIVDALADNGTTED